MTTRRSLALLLLVFTTALVAPRPSVAEPLERIDHDLQLNDIHFGLHLGGNITNATFGTVSLVAGIYNFGLVGSGLGGTQSFLHGLYMVSLGAASMISSASTIDSNVRMWKSLRTSFSAASEPERRLLRAAAAARLRAVAVNRAIGLAADGTFLGIGIALAVASPTGLGSLLVVNGAFVLGIDIFKLAVDDQTALQWEERDRDADDGYFTHRRVRPRLLSWGAAPLTLPDGNGGWTPGAAFSLAGVF